MHPWLRFYLPMAMLVAAGFMLALWYMRPAPPSSIRMATGPADGAYAVFGARLQSFLAAQGVRVELVTTDGTLENLQLLSKRTGGVDLAIAQARVGTAERFPGVVSLASISREPLWIFARSPEPPRSAAWLRGRRLSVGLRGSGSGVMADDLLDIAGLTDSVERVYLGNAEAADALIAGEIDASLFVTVGYHDVLRRLLQDPDIHLASLDNALAFKRHFRDVSVITIPQGLLDLRSLLPREDIVTIAPLVGLVASDELHPALIVLLLRATQEIARDGNLFNEPGLFPAPTFDNFPISEDAARFFAEGPGLLDRWLPYWLSNLVQRTAILLLPLITLAFPFFRYGPTAFRWHMRRQVYRWYRELRRIERDVRADPSPDNRQARIAELDRLQDDIGSVSVPLAYAEHLYHLRMHVLFLRVLLDTQSVGGNADGTIADGPAGRARLKQLMARLGPAAGETQTK